MCLPSLAVAVGQVGGRMVIPVGPDSFGQEFLKIDRIKGHPSEDINEKVHMTDFTIEPLIGVRYVPLVKPSGGF